VKTLDVTKLISCAVDMYFRAPFEKYLYDDTIVNYVAQRFFTGSLFFASRQKLFSLFLDVFGSKISILVV